MSTVAALEVEIGYCAFRTVPLICCFGACGIDYHRDFPFVDGLRTTSAYATRREDRTEGIRSLASLCSREKGSSRHAWPNSDGNTGGRLHLIG